MEINTGTELQPFNSRFNSEQACACPEDYPELKKRCGRSCCRCVWQCRCFLTPG